MIAGTILGVQTSVCKSFWSLASCNITYAFAGCVNRCQQDINNSRSMADARKAEQEFFDSHEEYTEVSNQCGTANLAKGLNRILVDHIYGLLPGLRATIEKEMDERAAELISYGEAPVGDTNTARCFK